MKQLLTQYGGLKREIYVLFIGKLVTAMGSFVWPMLTFFQPLPFPSPLPCWAASWQTVSAARPSLFYLTV